MNSIWMIRLGAVGVVMICFAAAFVDGASGAFSQVASVEAAQVQTVQR